MFYLTTHSTHFIYSYMASDIWLRTILIVRKETRCRPEEQDGCQRFHNQHPSQTYFTTSVYFSSRNKLFISNCHKPTSLHRSTSAVGINYLSASDCHKPTSLHWSTSAVGINYQQQTVTNLLHYIGLLQQ